FVVAECIFINQGYPCVWLFLHVAVFLSNFQLEDDVANGTLTGTMLFKPFSHQNQISLLLKYPASGILLW
ncbi:hypothetical protein V4Y02_23905, partial [Escherichia coli]